MLRVAVSEAGVIRSLAVRAVTESPDSGNGRSGSITQTLEGSFPNLSMIVLTFPIASMTAGGLSAVASRGSHFILFFSFHFCVTPFSFIVNGGALPAPSGF